MLVYIKIQCEPLTVHEGGYVSLVRPLKQLSIINNVMPLVGRQHTLLIWAAEAAAWTGESWDFFCIYNHHTLTPWSRVVLEKLTVTQLVNKFHTSHGNRRFITAFTTARHWYL